nr:BapA prefix-like domain-containing protein [Celeribacter baekdonensis]
MSGLVAGDAVDVQVNVNRESISRYVKSNSDLVVELVNGDSIRVSNFYDAAGNGDAHRLILADGTFSGVEGAFGEDAAVAGLGSGFTLDEVGAGLAALAGLGAAALSGDLPLTRPRSQSRHLSRNQSQRQNLPLKAVCWIPFLPMMVCLAL